MAWEILDWYKKAKGLTREIDIEMEAQALSRIGKFYDEVMESPSKAKPNFKEAIHLAQSLPHKNLANEGVYYFWLYRTNTIMCF